MVSCPRSELTLTVPRQPSRPPVPHDFAPADQETDQTEALVTEYSLRLVENMQIILPQREEKSEMFQLRLPNLHYAMMMNYYPLRKYFIDTSASPKRVDKYRLVRCMHPNPDIALNREEAEKTIDYLELQFLGTVDQQRQKRRTHGLYVPKGIRSPESLAHMAYLLADLAAKQVPHETHPYASGQDALDQLHLWAMDSINQNSDGLNHGSYSRLIQHFGAHLHQIWAKHMLGDWTTAKKLKKKKLLLQTNHQLHELYEPQRRDRRHLQYYLFQRLRAKISDSDPNPHWNSGNGDRYKVGPGVDCVFRPAPPSQLSKLLETSARSGKAPSRFHQYISPFIPRVTPQNVHGPELWQRR